MYLSDLTNLILAPYQQTAIQNATDQKVFLRGAAGTGKTTAALLHLVHLLESGIPAENIMILVPQRTLAEPFYDLLRDPSLVAGGIPNVVTVGGLARRMIDLFWPLVAEEADFADPTNRPVFLTLETAQYYMARVVQPKIEELGYFESIVISRNRLYSQIIDNMNKAAVVGFPLTDISRRLSEAWVGEQAHTRVYEQAQDCAIAFRNYCLQHNLLDFSLQTEIFFKHLWLEPLCRNYIEDTYSHLIFENVEEDTPVAHDMVASMLNSLDSALLIYDEDAGYRQFLGADAEGALMLADICDEQINAETTFISSYPLRKFGVALADILGRKLSPQSDSPAPEKQNKKSESNMASALEFEIHRYHPQMLDWVAREIAELVNVKGVNPSDIVVISPFLSDALKFSLMYRLSQENIPVRTHRPSRALRDEPVTRTLLTFASLAHPVWDLPPAKYDMMFALVRAIKDLDVVRAKLITEILYRIGEDGAVLQQFDNINPEMQQRITYVLGDRYERLRQWLMTAQAESPGPLDHFLSRLFGEVLSIAEFGFHDDIEAGRVAAVLIESVRKFRWICTDIPDYGQQGAEYLRLVRDGVIAAQYLTSWQQQEENAVLLSPAYTFLLSNRPVAIQFWLNVGGKGWWERLYQPLTHPIVLSRRWTSGKPWTDADEFESRQESMFRVALGLIRRCRDKIYLGLSELGEEGFEQEGALLKAIQRVLRRKEFYLNGRKQYGDEI